MVELRGVSKRYGGHVVLHPTDFVAEPGKNTVLIGQSGCGKSTLLRLVIGLIKADTGTVTIAGEQLTPQSRRHLRHRMGYVIQDGGLFPHLTVRDNVALLARHLGWTEDRVAKRTAELAALAKLPDGMLDRFPAQISGGQRQRVSLMRALMLDPEVLLLDEPLGALDPIIRSEVQEDLRRVFKQLNKTVILVTHDLGEAWFFGDAIVLMRDGLVVQRGTLEDLMERPAEPFVTRFVKAQRSPIP